MIKEGVEGFEFSRNVRFTRSWSNVLVYINNKLVNFTTLYDQIIKQSNVSFDDSCGSIIAEKNYRTRAYACILLQYHYLYISRMNRQRKHFIVFNVVRLDVFHQYQKRKVYMNLSSILWQHLISTSLIITNIMYIQLFVSSRNVLKADMVWQGLKTDLSLNLIWYVFPYWFGISQT